MVKRAMGVILLSSFKILFYVIRVRVLELGFVLVRSIYEMGKMGITKGVRLFFCCQFVWLEKKMKIGLSVLAFVLPFFFLLGFC